MGPYDEIGMTPLGVAMAGMYAPTAAAPAGTVPAPPSLLDYGDQGQPQGLWGQLTGAGSGAGLAGNPLFMAGLQGMVAANRGDDTARAMARGFAGAQQALRTQEARRRGTSTDRFRQFQMDRLARAEQRQEDQRASLQSALGNVSGTFWDSVPGLREAAQADPELARALLSAQAQQAIKPPGTAEGADGHLYYTTGPARGQRVLPGVTKAGDWGAVGDDYLYNKATGELKAVGTAANPGAFSREEIAKQARDLDATNESWVEATLAGDPTKLVPRNPMDVPADRGEVGAFLDKAETQLKPLRKQAGAYKRLQIALQEGSSIADVMSIYETIKALDPESVVREGEIAIVKAAMPTLQRLEGVLRRESNQGFLTPQTRAELASVSSKIQGALERSAQKTIEDLGKRAKVMRMPGDVMEGTSRPTFGDQSVWEDIISRAGGGAPRVLSDNPEVEQFVPTRF